ncbi:MAG: caspase family protein [Coleofasciculus sp. C1-SOL-03]|uniref:nSTAND1 domain-containing NTPase n=1 Tax=Coleofasciculus sp. C1-SOL-03 TaxID=3069522 RepID=UPI0032F0ECF0
MDREALVVGINLYPLLRDGRTEKPRHLDKPAADAEAVAQVLETYGQFRVRRLPEVYDDAGNPQVAAKPHPTQLVRVKTLQEAIANLFNPPSRQVPDTALLFFAGHGLRNDQGGVSEGFLATSDVKPQDGKWGVSLQWLRRLLQESPVRQQIVWLDCCHSGELLNFLEADPGAMGEARDRCFIAASRDFEVAYEEFGGQHGVLTGALLPGLRPEGKSQGWVTNYSLVEAINRQLLTSRQRPIFHNSGGEILLTGRKETIERAVLMAGVCPYKGLESFEFNDHDPKYFYGRTALTDQLLAKIRQGNFLAVVGASGSGKSSLVKAGLLYQLKLGQRLSGSDQWAIRIFRPGEHPLKSLALAFVDEATESGDVERLASQGAAGLAELVGAIDAPRVVLVVDQFEEVFTLCQDDRERGHFLECLLGSTSPLTPPLAGEGNMAAVNPLNSVDHVGAQGLRPNQRPDVRPNQRITSDQKLPDYQQGQGLESTSPLAPPLQGEGNMAAVNPLNSVDHVGAQGLRPHQRPDVRPNQRITSDHQQTQDETLAPPSLAGKGAGGLGLRLNLTVVITMRADFFGKCAEQDYGGLAHRIQENLVTITPMKTEELAAAITEPAKQVGLEIERELVTQMLHDVEGPGSLPLLQYTLTELWRQRQMNLLTLADYTKLGGVKGTLQKRADQVYESLSKEQQLIAKRIFLELTQLGEGTEDTRRQVFKQEFINDELSKELVEQVITQLADARLLVTSQLRVRGESGATLTVVDVAHEALIRHWTRLRQWLNENREAMRKERKLEEAANEWESQGKPEERAFLLEGPKLQEAESFLEEYAHLGLLSNVAQEFIRVSQAYQERLRQQEEERQRRERKQTRRTIQVGIVSLIFVTGLAVVAVGFGLRSRKQAQIANAKELAATAEWIRSQPGLYQTSVLLAVESMERFQTLKEPSIEADRALREGLTLLPATVSQVSHESGVNAVAFSPDGEWLATASSDKTARISQVSSGKEVAWISHKSGVNAVVFSPDGELVATASQDNTARISQVSSGKEVARISHENTVNAVAFSPDGELVATASQDNTARITQVSSGKELARISHESGVNAVAFSPDGELVATASWDKTSRISQVSSGKEVARISHESGVNDVAFSPDGELVATASGDNTARISQVSSGKEVARISHESPVIAMVFSPDGELVATASYDNTAEVHWREPQPLVKKPCQHLSRNLTASEWQTYIGELDQYRKICLNRPIHPSVLTEAKTLVRQGNKKDALAIIRRAKSLDPDIDLNPDTEALDQDPKIVLQQFSALAQVEEGEKLAREGKVKEAIASYTQALDFDPDVDLNPDTDAIENDPQAVAHALAAPGKVEEGEKLARQGQIQEAITSYTQALKFNPDIDLNPYTEDKENDPQAVAQTLAAQSQVEKGGRLAQQGKIKEAIASYTQALKFNPDIDLNPYTEDKEKEPKAVAHKFVAQGKVWEGQSLAREGKIKEAIASYTQALNFDPDIDLNPDTEAIENEPKAVAHTLAAPGKVEEGEKLARQGKIQEAIASYTQALNFDPDIDLNPDTEDKDNEPKAVAHKFAAPGKVEEGKELALEGKIKEAIASYTQAQKLAPNLEISEIALDTLCWRGTLHGHTADVMSFCDKGVEMYPQYGSIRESRGLARARTGNIEGAIEDFQSAIKLTDNDEIKSRSQRWIDELRAGKNPFTPEELERLFNE